MQSQVSVNAVKNRKQDVLNITKLDKVIVFQDVIDRIIGIQQSLSLTPPGHKAHVFDLREPSIIGLVLNIALQSLHS